MKRFDHKICVITGATNGIGKQMAFDFHAAGATVYNLDIEAPAQINAHQRYIKCDLRDAVQVQQAVQTILEEAGKVDILINNACFSNKGVLSECSAAAFNDVLMVGVTAPYLLTLGFKNHFSEGASMVNIASTRAFMSQCDTESYSAAKGGILALTHALSISLAGKVRVNAINPGWIDTTEDDFDVLDHVQQPVGRIGKPEDISKMALFLCSDEAGFITGENITIDGGMTKQMIYHGEAGWTLNLL